MNWNAVYEIDRSGAGTQFIPFVYMGLGLLAVALILHLWARRHGRRSAVARFLVIGGVLIGALGYGVNTWDQIVWQNSSRRARLRWWRARWWPIGSGARM